MVNILRTNQQLHRFNLQFSFVPKNAKSLESQCDLAGEVWKYLENSVGKKLDWKLKQLDFEA